MSPLAALLLDWVITAFWPIIGNAGMKHFSSVLFAEAGLAVGFILLFPWVVTGGRWRKILARETAPLLLGMGFFSGVAATIFINALSYTTPANAAIMSQVEVLYSALLCALILKEKVSWGQLAASSLVVAGTGLIMAHDLSSLRWKGDLMILATPWMFQVSHVLSKRLPPGLDAITIAGGRVFYGFLALLPLCLLSPGPARWSISPEALVLIGAQGLVLSSLNFVLWYRAIRNMDLSKATTIMLSYPALTLLFSWALGREEIVFLQVAGLVITLSGAAWVSRLVLRAQKETGRSLPGTIPSRQD